MIRIDYKAQTIDLHGLEDRFKGPPKHVTSPESASEALRLLGSQSRPGRSRALDFPISKLKMVYC